MQRRTSMALIGIAAVGAAVLMLVVKSNLPASFRGDSSVPRSHPTAQTPSGSRAHALPQGIGLPVEGSVTGFVTGLENLPASLRGTEVDGALEVDAEGHLIINSRVRQLFDYFLSVQGEEPLETVLARLDAFIRHHLPPQAAAEAQALLSDYIEYLKKAVELQSPAVPGEALDLDAIRAYKVALGTMRKAMLGQQAADAFFAEEDAYDQYTLARLEVMREDGLTPEERASRLASLENQLPASTRESLLEISRFQNLQALTQQWRQEDGSPATLRRIRENLLGPQAADRLEQLDVERQSWEARVRSWLAERDQLRHLDGLDEQDIQTQLERLRAQRFSSEEMNRVHALERISDQGALDAVLGK